ncbi:MAG: tRNA (guanosine(46)-N7)-methyltransferase TrmB [Verrucomicrobia bacterium]|nr:MAG: tRNA (guanosine(46)-N7)-methyltransferase TrmB [Verrucomicrobiota bacterium]
MTTPGVLPESLLHEITSLTDPVDLAALFPERRPVELELGAGDGSFLLEYAARHPEHNFVGIERLFGRLRKIDRKGRRLGLLNIRGIRIEAAYFMRYLLPPASIVALHVYFPDPWPKKRHRWRRLVNEEFVRLAWNALQPAGCVHLRTDHADYFEQMQTVFAAHPGFEPVPTPPDLLAVQTDFEKEFLAEGRAIHRASYRKRSTG